MIKILLRNEYERGGPGSGGAREGAGRPRGDSNMQIVYNDTVINNLPKAHFSKKADTEFREALKRNANIKEISFESMEKDGPIARTGAGITGPVMVVLNSDIVHGDLSEFRSRLADANASGFLVPRDLNEIMMHEGVHVRMTNLDMPYVVYNSDVFGNADVQSAFHSYLGYGVSNVDWSQQVHDGLSELGKDVSRYALSTPGEFIAETYVASRTGRLSGDTAKIGTAIVNAVDNLDLTL